MSERVRDQALTAHVGACVRGAPTSRVLVLLCAKGLGLVCVCVCAVTLHDISGIRGQAYIEDIHSVPLSCKSAHDLGGGGSRSRPARING